MRSCGLLALVTMTQHSALVIANPVTNNTPSPLSPRAAQPTCDNSISTIAGTMFNGPGQISPSVAIHATDGTGFSESAPISDASDPLFIAVSTLLSQVYDAITAHIKASGDGVMNKDASLYRAGPVAVARMNSQVVFSSQNGPEGMMTLGVLGAAVGALRDQMGRYGFGLMDNFLVRDDKHAVGAASIRAQNIDFG
ncbi:MAG: hypothetical protein FRX48_00412 [Lasallia pustulata]|uniref:Uncharacterized protein n=1 Tax=Lasallia pustulata TaxID=136370 RepID=A0A5M8Q0L4_9LECA|nr:MAG: hypothetical protein FRX48_00412 [Lasallia pustulata]